MRDRRPRSKPCARCREVKPLRQFGDNLRMRLGKKSYCRQCEREAKAEWKRRQVDKKK